MSRRKYQLQPWSQTFSSLEETIFDQKEDLMSNFAITIEEDKPGSGSIFGAPLAFIFIIRSSGDELGLQIQKKSEPRHIYRVPKHHISPKIHLWHIF